MENWKAFEVNRLKKNEREVEMTKTHILAVEMKELSAKKMDFCLGFLDTLERGSLSFVYLEPTGKTC